MPNESHRLGYVNRVPGRKDRVCFWESELMPREVRQKCHCTPNPETRRGWLQKTRRAREKYSMGQKWTGSKGGIKKKEHSVTLLACARGGGKVGREKAQS